MASSPLFQGGNVGSIPARTASVIFLIFGMLRKRDLKRPTFFPNLVRLQDVPIIYGSPDRELRVNLGKFSAQNLLVPINGVQG